MRSSVAVLCLSLAVALFFGCRGPFSSDALIPHPNRDKVFDTAHVVCTGDGIHVLTPKVEAQPDGVHLVLENRLRGDADFDVDSPGGGMGWNVPGGESKRVGYIPPGTARISCYRRFWIMEDLTEGDPKSLKIVAGDSGYRSTRLDCPRGKPVGGMRPYSKDELGGRGNPVKLFRHILSSSLEKSDIVEVGGYPESRDEKIVRMVRDGKVVATAHYFRVSDGWLGGLTENCAGL